jgi:hypothetical protein
MFLQYIKYIIPSITLLYPILPYSWNSFNRYHFCTVLTLLPLFPDTSPLPLSPTPLPPWTGPVPPSCFPILKKKKKEKEMTFLLV